MKTEKRSTPINHWRVVVIRVAAMCVLSGLMVLTLSSMFYARASAHVPTSWDMADSQAARRPAVSLTMTYQTYLPLITRNYPRLSVMGAQMYSLISPRTGFTLVTEARMSWVRFQVNWSTIEPQNTTPENYQWTSLDASLATAQGAGVQTILTIEGNPPWAASSPGGPVTNTADLVEFVSAVARRYPFVQYFEMYNEPDNISRYGLKGDQYAQMLKAVYPAIKAANPGAQVVMGGLGLDWFIDQYGAFDRGFLSATLQVCGTAPCFDVANFHYYSFFRSQWEPYGRDIIGKANYVRQVLAAFQLVKPLMATETTWPSVPVWGGPEIAARYVPKAYARSMAANLSATIWFALLDATPDQPGLLDSTSTPGMLIPRPAYDAARVAIDRLSGAKYVQTITQTGASSPIEGYQFTTAEGKRLDVYWYECPSMVTMTPPQDCENVAPLKIAASRVAKIDKFGNTTIVLDEDDGYRDGWITLGVLSSPIYIDYAP